MNYKQVIVTQFGGPDVLNIEEKELQPLKPGEVRIKMLTAGVAWGDMLNRQGYGLGRPPFTPGYDLVGTVDAIGEVVKSIEVGQLVAALPMLGGYSEYLHLPATDLVPVPDGIDPAEAACLVLNYVAAYQLLHRAAKVRKGERVLVFNAGGGVGTALLQLGQIAGLCMVGVTSKQKMEIVKSLGGTAINRDLIDRKQKLIDSVGGELDVVLDPYGGAYTRKIYSMLNRGGRIVVYGVHTIGSDGLFKMLPGFLLNVLMNFIPDSKKVVNYSITKPKFSSPARCLEDLSILLDLLSQGLIKPIIAERIPFSDVMSAHQKLAGGSVTGKLVLVST